MIGNLNKLNNNWNVKRKKLANPLSWTADDIFETP